LKPGDYRVRKVVDKKHMYHSAGLSLGGALWKVGLHT